MDVLLEKQMKSLIDRISHHKPRNFIAPVMTKRAKLFVIQDDIPYWFVAQTDQPGWYYLEPRVKVGKGRGEIRASARVLREAEPHEYINYLRVLPSFFVIALFPINTSTWLVMPYNISDGEQRGWENGVPRPMYLVQENISALDIVKARVLTGSLIFDRLSSILGADTKETQIAQSIYDRRLQIVREQEAQQERANKLKTERGRLEESLAFMGAELKDWTRELDGYIVRWELDGQVYRMQVDPNLRVTSAGVCLDGTDDWHSLSSVVDVMKERAKAIANDDHGDW